VIARRLGRIGMWRRAVQAVSFSLLVYGAFLIPSRMEMSLLPALKPPPGEPSTTRFDRGKILWAADNPPRVDSYPPAAACRFMPKGGMFKACILHFLSENLTWRTSFKHMLPHLLFYVALAFIFARLWCGWVCPLGSVGDVLCYARKKLGFDHLKFSPAAQRLLKTGNYAILALALGLSILAAWPPLSVCKDQLFLPYCQMCPGRAIFPLFGATIPNLGDFSTAIYGTFTVLGWLFLATFVLAFFTGKNVWCRICPIGTFTSFFNRGAGASLIKNAAKCSSCGVCADCCPVASTRVYNAKESGDTSHADCILCLRCVEMCPKDGCLAFKLFGREVARSAFQPQAAGERDSQPS